MRYNDGHQIMHKNRTNKQHYSNYHRYYKKNTMRVPQFSSHMTATIIVMAIVVLLSATYVDTTYAGTIYDNKAYAQTNLQNIQTIADHIVINEVDTNPQGKSSENIFDWIEIYNPTTSQVDLSGWQIASSTGTSNVITIQQNTIIKPGQFITYANQQIRFTDINEVIELRNAVGEIIDKTPKITDKYDDHRSWQRIYDGYKLNGNAADWKFSTQSPGASNGKAPQNIERNQVEITIMTDKESYNLGQTVSISGTVSERKFVEKPYFTSEKITLHITGPNYNKEFVMYPDLRLGFSTTLDLHKVLNIEVGTYNISAKYAGATATTSFTVDATRAQNNIIQAKGITISTDSASYIQGQEIIITGATQKQVQFATFKITIKDANNKTVSSGNSIPTDDGKIKSIVTLNELNPAYGTYTVTAEYANEKATTTFEMMPKIKQDSQITIITDKRAYAQGESVTIRGMLNDIWRQVVNVEILQTKQGVIADIDASSHTGFKIDESVQVLEDGSFEYTFGIPNKIQSLGDYKITITGNGIHPSSAIISVVKDPQSFIINTEPLTIHTDKTTYAHNEYITFTGYAADITSTTVGYVASRVSITITDEQGVALQSDVTTKDTQSDIVDNRRITTYETNVIPNESGKYTAKVRVQTSIFDEGNYTAIATYQEHKATVAFTIINQYNISKAEISTDKEVYGLNETVVLNGVFPVTAANEVYVTLVKPDGSTIRSSAAIQDQRFVWEWDTPKVERKHSIKEGELRGITLSVFGVYKLKIFTESESVIKYFKISDDPENDTLADTPLFVTTDKPIYKPGDKLIVSGNVLLYDESTEELREPPRVTIVVKKAVPPFNNIYQSRVYPDNAGAFSSEFTLPVTIFKEDTYRVDAQYESTKASTVFRMLNDYVYGGKGPISLNVSTDRDIYNPGQTVTISGSPNKIIYIEKYEVSVSKKVHDGVDCNLQACGVHATPTTIISPDSTASFVHQYMIPQWVNAIGTYEVVIESSIGINRITFDVVKEEKPEPINQTVSQQFTPKVIIDRYNRLAETEFNIRTYSNTTLEHENDTVIASPVSLVGSMITTKGHEHLVNLQVSTSDGTCVIGQPSEDCMISESTRSQGRIFDVVFLNNETSLRVIYSGTDVRLEKFAIYPNGQTSLPDMTWNVTITKDKNEQPSRFYYKVTYKTIPQG